MISQRPAFVAFEPKDGTFKAFVSMEALLSMEGEPDVTLSQAAKVYELATIDLRSIVSEIQSLRSTHKLTPAREIWRLGNRIFKLKDDLANLSLELDSFYEHLVRDLGVKRKWLEKVVIFRRYLPRESLVPKTLNWGRCEKGTKKAALRLRDGMTV